MEHESVQHSFPLTMVSADKLIWAAAEVASAVRSRNPGYTGLPQRLHQLIRDERSAPRAFLEDKLLAPFGRAATSAVAAATTTTTTNTSAGGSLRAGMNQPNTPPLPIVAPTAKELAAAGLSLARIRQLETQLTPKALILVGVLRSWHDARLLGLTDSFGDFLDQLGQPYDVAKWLRSATGSEQAWKTNFLVPLAFDAATWAAHATRLTPRDLTALDFCLGAQLEANSRLEKSVPASTWLGRARSDEWLASRQLTPGQYARLSGNGNSVPDPAPVPLFVAKSESKLGSSNGVVIIKQ